MSFTVVTHSSLSRFAHIDAGNFDSSFSGFIAVDLFEVLERVSKLVRGHSFSNIVHDLVHVGGIAILILLDINALAISFGNELSLAHLSSVISIALFYIGLELSPQAVFVNIRFEKGLVEDLGFLFEILRHHSDCQSVRGIIVRCHDVSAVGVFDVVKSPFAKTRQTATAIID